MIENDTEFSGFSFTQDGIKPTFRRKERVSDVVDHSCATCYKEITEGYAHVEDPIMYGNITNHYCSLLCVSEFINPMSKAPFTLVDGVLYTPFDPGEPNYNDDPSLQNNWYPEGNIVKFRQQGIRDVTFFEGVVMSFSEGKKDPTCSVCNKRVYKDYLTEIGMMMPEHIKVIKHYCDSDCYLSKGDSWELKTGRLYVKVGEDDYPLRKW